jgi:peptidoglycan/xylan/chitin deacetylase (PgdA/CDA1 family)
LSKRNRVAELSSTLGLIRILEVLARRDCLAIINYHRIGDKDLEVFDELVYSATAAEFRQQMEYVAKRFRLITLAEAVDAISGNRRFRGPAVLITFDDGYVDHYRLAFPILRSLGIQATFFLISSYLHDPVIPWWDKIAYMIRNSERDTLRLSYPESVEIVLGSGRRAAAISRVLDLYKSPGMTDGERFMGELEEACTPFPAIRTDTRLFLNAQEAREMVEGGMAIGSHTRTHRILSRLSQDEQISELIGSQMDLERDLGVEIDTIAYPVGTLTAFSDATLSILKGRNYRAGFSFYGGLNQFPVPARFDVKRFGRAWGDSLSRFRLKVAGAIVTNGYLF